MTNTNPMLGSFMLLFLLLNPFLVIIYLIDPVRRLQGDDFRKVVVQGGVIAIGVLSVFAVVGDRLFADVVQAEFASFQIFGGLIFILIGLQFVFQGPTAIQLLRGETTAIAGAIAMPVLIGPGTISASILIGKRHDAWLACGIVVVAVAACIASIIVLKWLHDLVLPRNEALIDRYIDVTGRISALYIGTIAVEMIMQGMLSWAEKMS